MFDDIAADETKAKRDFFYIKLRVYYMQHRYMDDISKCVRESKRENNI